MEKKILGLTTEQANNSREINGSNQLSQRETETCLHKYLGNFKDPIIRILMVALAINVIFMFMGKSHWYETAGILLAVILATFVSTLSEFRNEVTFQKLQDEASKTFCKVYRDGIVHEISVDDLVVGDVVVLQSGDKIQADGKMIEGYIKVDQATLNGESKEAEKKKVPDDYVESEDVDFLDIYKVFRGSVVCSGEGVMEVTLVGNKTVFGSITQEIQIDERDSPLKVKLSALASSISKFGYMGGIGIAVAFMLTKMIGVDNYFADMGVVFTDFVNAIILAVIIIVVAVPEGLPLMIAIVSSLNMSKMLKDNVLVRKIAGIETAGSLNILFSDKTGTITKGKLEVVTFINGLKKEYKSFNEIESKLRHLLHLSMVYNSSSMMNIENGQRTILGGNATERALLGFVDESDIKEYHITKTRTEPFNSTVKFSATSVVGDYEYTLIKGAPEKLLNRCKNCFDENGEIVPLDNLETLNKELDTLAERAIRVLALAASTSPINEDGTVDGDLTLVGVVGIRDEVRPEAIEAISEVNAAGVQVVMITGDRRETAIAIAKESGLLTKETDIVLTSDEVKACTDDELKQKLPNIRVISRALPSDKSRLVRISQECNKVVGMTGDGVNDSPALKRADVGFAMGSGTEVAKEAGDIVILDDNFLSIAKAILYGRTIYNNIRKFIVFQLTINVSAVLISFICPLLGLEVKPLDITQMLWINLIMDTLAAIAFGGEPALKRYMTEKPKSRDESIVSRDMMSAILVSGIYISIVSLIFLFTDIFQDMFRVAPGTELVETGKYFFTGFFTFFVFISMFNGFNARAERLNIFENIMKNTSFLKVMFLICVVQVIITYLGGVILRTYGLVASEWIVVILLALSIIPVDMVRKMIMGIK